MSSLVMEIVVTVVVLEILCMENHVINIFITFVDIVDQEQILSS